MDGEMFLAWVSQGFAPALRPGDVVILENLATHKIQGVREVIEATGARLLYLPPYSPDFNPIEPMWSKIKQILRSHAPRTDADQPLPNISICRGVWNSGCFRALLSFPKKLQQVGVDLLRVGGGHAMRKAGIDLQVCILQYLRGHQTRGANRHNLIVVAMHHQHGDVDLLQVYGEVGLRERLNAVVMGLDASHHALQPPALTDALRNLCARAVVSVKGKRDVLVELRAVGRQCCPKAVEDRDGQTARILFGFQHERWHGAD